MAEDFRKVNHPRESNHIARWASCRRIGRAEHEDALVARDELAGGEIDDLGLVELGLKLKSKPSSVLVGSKAARRSRKRSLLCAHGARLRRAAPPTAIVDPEAALAVRS
jgi:hypothetical protein